MAVIRINKTSDYTVMSNMHFKEKEMSLRAKGLLSLMLSLPDEWDYSVDGLCSLSKDGRDSVLDALNELEQFNYLKRTRERENGKLKGIRYDVYEAPYTEMPITEKPITEKPITEKPTLANPQQLNTNNKSHTQEINYLINRKERVKEKNQIPPSIEDVQTYIHDNRLNVDANRFMDYYESNGWKVGKAKMKDWQATLRNWNRRNEADKPRTDEIPSYDSSSNPDVALERLEGLRKV